MAICRAFWVIWSVYMTNSRTRALGAIVIIMVALAAYGVWRLRPGSASELGATTSANAEQSAAPTTPPRDRNSIDLSDSQLSSVKVEPVAEHEFPVEKEAIGSIDFNEDLAVQVFTPYQGRILALYASVGDDVKKGQTLFTIDSPDLLQAESTLIAAAGVLEMTTRNLARLRELYKTLAISQRELEQSASDQQTAEGNLRAARDAVRIFGKSDSEIDAIVAARAADPTLVVSSPIDGRITQRNAAPGLFVQPANPPPPYVVANIDTMWMLAQVPEADSPAFRVGQHVQVEIAAFPGRRFRRHHHHHWRDGRPGHAACSGPLRDCRSETRTALEHVREFHHQRRRAGALARHSTRWRGPRGRWHDDGVGDGRSPAVHQAHGADWPRARRSAANSQWASSRRTGRDLRRHFSQQRIGACAVMMAARAEPQVMAE